MRVRHFMLTAALVAAFFGPQCSHLQAQQTAPAAAPGGAVQTGTAPSSTLQWQNSLEEARQLAAKTNRLVLVHFWSPSCIPCMQLEQNVFAQPSVQQAIHAKFVPIKLNADEFPTTAKEYGITRLPSDLVITPSGQIVGRMVSPAAPDVYLQQLTIAASGTGPAASPAGAAYVGAPTAAPAVSPIAAPQQAVAQTPSAAPANNTAAANAVGSRYSDFAQAAASVAPVATPPAAVTPVPPTTANAAAPAPKATAPAIAAYADSRYNEYFERFGSGAPPAATGAAPTAQPSAINNPAAATAGVPAAVPSAYETVTNPYTAGPRYSAAQAQTSAPAGYAPPVAQNQPTYAPPAVNSGAPATAGGAGQFATNPPQVSNGIATAAPTQPGEAPLGMEGFSPVALVEQGRWVLGDRRWGVVHRGRTYLFAAPEEQQKFLASPDRYSPALSGRDVVAALDFGQEVEGKRQFGFTFENRVYMFSSAASQRQFSQNPARYIAPVMQAETVNQTVRR
jgi:YHS domain-containing protein/thiol-disulfide isomerase/thioredoxin